MKMEIYLFTSDLELIYENSQVILTFIYDGIIQITNYFNI